MHQAPLSMESSRQEYWSVFPFPSPGDHPDPGIKPGSAALWTDSLPSESLGKTKFCRAEAFSAIFCLAFSVVQDTILMIDIKYQQILCMLLSCRKLGLHIEFTISS